jgi:hypothetical protein
MPGLVVKPFYKFCARVQAMLVLKNTSCPFSSLRAWSCAAEQTAGRSMQDGCRVDIEMSISH